MLMLENVSKQFGEFKAVQDISFTVEQGVSYGLLGPNGAGKSTTIHMIAGLLNPTKGNILIDSINIQKNRQKAQSLLGVVPQEIALYQDFSAEDNLKFWGRMYNLSGQELTKQIDRTLEIVGLTDRKKGRVETFSGGMKRRINIACALLHNPKILIMDEPTVGIDPQSRNHILETVKQLNAEGMTIIYTSHYMEEVQYLCNRVGIIDQGQLIADGKIEDVLKQFGDMAEVRIQFDYNEITMQEAIEKQLELAFQPISQGAVRVMQKEVTIYHKQPETIIHEVATIMTKLNLRLQGIKVIESNLESVFLQLTGRALRDS